MSAPRTKRPFAGAASDPAQRQITSFFRPSCGGEGDGDESGYQTAVSLTPAQVQADLLCVGMRIRKSVPEGYKTGSDCGSFSLWSDADPKQAASSRHQHQQSSRVPSSARAAEKRELLPFCGIHKVGGLASQPAFDSAGPALFPPSAFGPSSSSSSSAAAAAAADDVSDMNDCPGLTSSQESAASFASVDTIASANNLLSSSSSLAPPPQRKRFYAEDESVEKPVSLRDEWLDGEVSPRTLAPVGWDNGRVMAVPRGRRGLLGLGGAAAAGGSRKGAPAVVASLPPARLTDLGQENLDLVMDGESDFEEASFLDFRTWGAPLPRDMEMGGI
ncbi:uncharacterized protein E0L32_010540 [Thyridium curvatum]|uniref:Uncharacterized protein n=1 Tax=Thyridium curvatum TaxID=1093900 RepID=A0A507AS97_9PEZI|nr:uncharacterized protein E0L32_010540 [Thyridium curvatum]TPX07748.1 hypothetical protein E0L32_010540 [Thyridium curvatum]